MMTAEQPIIAVTVQLLDNLAEEMSEMLSYLYFRWLDEGRYERIEEYGDVIQEHLKRFHKDITFHGMIKRPFGFHIRVHNRNITFTVSKKCITYKTRRV